MSGLPTGWKETTLAAAAHVVLGQSPPGASYNSSGVGVPFFQGKAEFTDKYAAVQKYTTAGTKFAEAEDILLSVRAPVGPTNLAPVHCAIGRGLAAIRAKEGVDQTYLRWYLRATEDVLASHGAGSTFKAVTGKQVREHRVVVPPLEEQRRIVEILEDHLSRVDSGVQGLSTALNRNERLRIATYHSVFSRYAALERPLTEAASIENGQTPKGLADLLSSSPSEESVPFYKVGDMNGGDGRRMPPARFYIDRRSAGDLGLHTRTPGLVLIPKRGGAIATNKKRILDVEAAYDLNTMGLRPRLGLSTEYLWRWFQGVDLGRIADGSAVPQINAKQIESARIPVLELAEQQAVLAELSKVVEASEAIDREIARADIRAAALRRALLAAAFSGKLTGAESDIERVEEMDGV